MKKIITIVAVIFALVSCGRETVVVMQPPTTDVPTQQTQTSNSGLLPEEEMLISFIESEFGPLDTGTIGLLIDTSYMICGELRLGATIDDLITMIIAASSGESSDKFLAAVSVGAIKYLCPDQDYKLSTSVF